MHITRTLAAARHQNSSGITGMRLLTIFHVLVIPALKIPSIFHRRFPLFDQKKRILTRPLLHTGTVLCFNANVLLGQLSVQALPAVLLEYFCYVRHDFNSFTSKLMID